LKGGVVEALGYAMSLPVLTTISGMDSRKVLQQNLEVARNFKRYPREQMASLRQRYADNVASDGRFELYKTTARFDADEGRAQHGFPGKDEKVT
jgi:hypothetical protein